jgi:diguanylate cyclase
VRYSEPKESAVQLLRQVLALSGQHEASPNPLTFAVLYEHAAGKHARLSEAFVKLQGEHGRLGDAHMQALHREHIAEPTAADAQRIQQDIQRTMNTIAESAAKTGREAGAFGAELEGLSGALSGQGGAAALVQQVGQARERTLAMQDSVRSLQSQLLSSQAEIERLRADLLRSREEATLCPLSGVLNRRGFDAKLGAMLGEPPPRGSTHCLVMLDIDHFKRVNDTHGHLVGDRVLAGLGEVLRSLPAEPGMACARYGGEEFAILLPATNLNRAVKVAEAVRTRVGQMRLRSRQTQEVRLQITVSAGVAAWQPGDDARALVACADGALYRAKDAGRDCVSVS